MKDDIIVQGKFYSEKKSNLKKIGFHFVTWNYPYWDEFMVHFRVQDQETGDFLCEETIKANQIMDHTVVNFPSSTVCLENNHWYNFQLYTTGETAEEHHISVVQSKEVTANLHKHYSSTIDTSTGQEEPSNLDIATDIVCLIRP